MFIIIFIIIIIITSEIYFTRMHYEPKNDTSKNSKKNKSITVLENNKGPDLFNEYSIKGDKKINHGPGKIMIKNDYNVFINTDNYNTLIKKDVIYDVDSPFEIEILNLSAENIKYYYISNS